MDFIKKRTHIINHERFLAAGPHARDLYDWGMLLSGQQETDGEISMVAVLSSPWGYGGQRNIKAAAKLVEVGLWERTDKGFRICRWTEQGNATKAQLDEHRTAARDRMRAKRSSSPPPAVRSQSVRANIERTSLDVPTSTSYCTSGSDLQGGAGGPPDWWAGAVDAAAMAVGVVDEPGARWLEYDASRERKGWSRNHRDAVGWLTAVVRDERKRAKSASSARGADVTKQPFDPDAPWMKLEEAG